MRLCVEMPIGISGVFSAAFLIWMELSVPVAGQSAPNGKPQNCPQMGVAGAAHAPVKDAQSRPITAGGFVDGAPVVFIDVTKQAGMDKFHHRSGTPEKKTIIEAPGSGVALLDYDNDGWLDVYLLNASTFSALRGEESSPHAMLLHNNHDGTFTNVTEKAGVANDRWGFGVGRTLSQKSGRAGALPREYTHGAGRLLLGSRSHQRGSRGSESLQRAISERLT